MLPAYIAVLHLFMLKVLLLYPSTQDRPCHIRHFTIHYLQPTKPAAPLPTALFSTILNIFLLSTNQPNIMLVAALMLL